MSNESLLKIQKAGEEFSSAYHMLRDVKWELENIIDYVPAFIALKDKHNNFVRVNKFLADFSEMSPKEIVGKNAADLYTKEQAEKFYKDDLAVLDHGIEKSYLETVSNKKGVTLITRTTKIPYRNPQGEIIGILLIALVVE